MIKFTVTSTKGGVGKTTLSANLAALFADLGLRVLLIDADVQPSLSKYFPLAAAAPGAGRCAGVPFLRLEPLAHDLARRYAS